jgi:hypothetical protein
MPLLDLLVLTNDNVGTIAFFNVRGVLHDSTPSHDLPSRKRPLLKRILSLLGLPIEVDETWYLLQAVNWFPGGLLLGLT